MPAKLIVRWDVKPAPVGVTPFTPTVRVPAVPELPMLIAKRLAVEVLALLLLTERKSAMASVPALMFTAPSRVPPVLEMVSVPVPAFVRLWSTLAVVLEAVKFPVMKVLPAPLIVIVRLVVSALLQKAPLKVRLPFMLFVMVEAAVPPWTGAAPKVIP